MDKSIYTNDELYEEEYSLEYIYKIIKNLDENIDCSDQLKKINPKFLKNVYQIQQNKKIHIGWLLSPFHYVSCDDKEIYFTYLFKFEYDTYNDIILIKDPTDYNQKYEKLNNLQFNIYICDAYEHHHIEYRVDHWLHKAALCGFPLHILMKCDCGKIDCKYDENEFYYNSRENGYLHKLGKNIPIIKVYITIHFNQDF